MRSEWESTYCPFSEYSSDEEFVLHPLQRDDQILHLIGDDIVHPDRDVPDVILRLPGACGLGETLQRQRRKLFPFLIKFTHRNGEMDIARRVCVPKKYFCTHGVSG